MRIIIDLQSAQIKNRPCDTTKHDLCLIKSIIHHGNEHEIIIILNHLAPETIEPLRSELSGLLPRENIRIWYTPVTITKKMPDSSWQVSITKIIREAFIANLNPDIVHVITQYSPHEDSTIVSIGCFSEPLPTIVTLHKQTESKNHADTNPPYRKKDNLKRLEKYKYLKHASLILTICDTVRKNLLEEFSISDKDIRCIPAAPEKSTHIASPDHDDAPRDIRKNYWDEQAKHILDIYEKTRNNKHAHWSKTETLHTLINKIAKIIPENTDNSVLIKTSYALSLNHPNTELKQIFLDVSDLAKIDIKTGIQRVVRSLLNELLTLNIEGIKFEPVYTTDEYGYRYARSFTSKFIGQQEAHDARDDYIEYHAGDIFFGLDFEAQLTINQNSFYQHLRRHGLKVMFLVHDLLPVTNPEWFPIGGDKVFMKWLEIITQTDGVICVSESTTNDLKSWIKTNNINTPPNFRASASHNGADIENSAPTRGLPNDADTTLQTIRNNTSFLMVGTIEPRKGHSQTINAFEKLWEKDEDIILIIVGKQGWMVDELINKIKHHPELDKRLFWLHGISDEFLEKIYAESSCLIAASEGEGFGLPLIEAAQHKLPIIARDIAVFREVAREHAYYFTGSSADALAEAIIEWITLKKDNQAPLSTNINWSTWKESAMRLFQILVRE